MDHPSGFNASGPLRGRIRFLRLLCCALALPACAQFAGCGGYREGVERTGRYLEYQQRLDEHLAKLPWSNDSFRMRIPRSFQIVDRRRENQGKPPLPPLIANLDGVEAVWRAELTCRDRQIRTGWLVVISNRHIWRRGTATLEDSERFAQQALRQIYQPSGDAPPAIEETDAKSIPADAEFSKPKAFLEFTTAYPRETAFPTAYTARVDLHVEQSLQVGVVWIIPETIDTQARQHLAEAVSMTLETLEITGPTTPAALSSQ